VLATKKPCTLTATENGFCKRHVSQIFLEEAACKGKVVCRHFDRGCRNFIDEDDVVKNIRSCKECRTKILGKAKECAHPSCTFKIKESDTYCGKHYRDYYYEKAKKEGIRYCDIERGCNSVLESDESKCHKCRAFMNECIAIELKTHRDVQELCLKCKTHTKSNGYFCDECCNEITFSSEFGKRKMVDVWRDFCKQAATRDHPVTIIYDEFVELVIQPCFYCGVFYESKYNGIDRYDNTHGYTKDNTRPCCTVCNIMKNDYDPILFYEKVKTIVEFQTYGTTNINDLVNKWSELQCNPPYTFQSYKHTALTRRKLEFTIEKEDYDKFRNGQCYLCGLTSSDTHKNGIDRIDNSKGYILDNCRSCCGHCNCMKLDLDYNVFITHCKQIVQFNRCREIIVSTSESKEHTYTANEIYYMLTTNQQKQYLEWAKCHGKSPMYLSDIQTIDLTKSKDDCVAEIRRFMEMERTRNYKMHHNDTPKHYSANSVYAMLTNNEQSSFVKWYEETYGMLSNSFHAQLDEVVSNLSALSKMDGVEACRKFLKAETSRRKSSKSHDLKRSVLSSKTGERSWKAKDISIETSASTESPTPANPVNEIVIESDISMPTIVPLQPISAKEPPLPKQWKSNIIYTFIKTNQGSLYKKYCEDNNEIANVDEWESKWKVFEDTVKLADSFESVKETISAFVIGLRKLRHDKILEKSKVDVLERTDRMIWPKETILKAWKTGKIQSYKEFLETTTSSDLISERWSRFLTTLESKTEDSELLKVIEKFQSALRIAKYRNKGKEK
jgi:hypothetical protein